MQLCKLSYLYVETGNEKTCLKKVTYLVTELLSQSKQGVVLYAQLKECDLEHGNRHVEISKIALFTG